VSDQQKIPSPKEVAALELLLSGREMYGLQMVEASEGNLRRGTVYVLLGRMEDQGLISSRPVESRGTGGLPRRLYRITGLGQRAYRAWSLAQSVLQGKFAI
jgi:PadR family transcriptional regulator